MSMMMMEAARSSQTFHNLNRSESESLLKRNRPYTFLYRPSSVADSIVMSLRDEDHIYHLLISVLADYYLFHNSAYRQLSSLENVHFMTNRFGTLDEGTRYISNVFSRDVYAILRDDCVNGHHEESKNELSELEMEYQGLLQGLLMSDVLPKNILVKIAAWRSQYKISPDQHLRVITKLGLTEQEFEDRLASQQMNVQEEAHEAQESREDDVICVVCMSNEKNAVFPACGHASTCIDCASVLDRCPLCRTRVGRKKPFRIYL